MFSITEVAINIYAIKHDSERIEYFSLLSKIGVKY